MFSVILAVIIAFYYIANRVRPRNKCVYVVILGDIGRSPRMQFHSISLAKAGFDVYVFGYPGSFTLNTVNKRIYLLLELGVKSKTLFLHGALETYKST